MIEQVWEEVGQVATPGFFVTAEFSRVGSSMPTALTSFLEDRLGRIRAGSPVRKFVYQEAGWRIVCTFFPTDRVVEERYALKNKAINRSM